MRQKSTYCFSIDYHNLNVVTGLYFLKTRCKRHFEGAKNIENMIQNVHITILFYFFVEIEKEVLLWQVSVATSPHIFVIATCI